jgi:hypothetical protein
VELRVAYPHNADFFNQSEAGEFVLFQAAEGFHDGFDFLGVRDVEVHENVIVVRRRGRRFRFDSFKRDREGIGEEREDAFEGSGPVGDSELESVESHGTRR